MDDILIQIYNENQQLDKLKDEYSDISLVKGQHARNTKKKIQRTKKIIEINENLKADQKEVDTKKTSLIAIESSVRDLKNRVSMLNQMIESQEIALAKKEKEIEIFEQKMNELEKLHEIDVFETTQHVNTYLPQDTLDNYRLLLESHTEFTDSSSGEFENILEQANNILDNSTNSVNNMFN